MAGESKLADEVARLLASPMHLRRVRKWTQAGKHGLLAVNVGDRSLADWVGGAAFFSVVAAFITSIAAKLATLTIQEHDMTAVEGCDAMAAALAKCKALTTLVIHKTKLGDAGIAALAPGLQDCSALTCLQLTSCGIGASGGGALAAALQHCTALTTLDLGGSPSQLQHHYVTVRAPEKQGNSLGDEGCAALSTVLHRLTALRSLILCSNNIGNAGCTALGIALQHSNMPSLTELDLADNKIGDAGCAALAMATQATSLPCLRALGLGGNAIGDEGCTALGRALQGTGTPTLRTLYLYRNKIGDAGYTALSTGLARCSLDKFNAFGNNIGDKGYAAMASALMQWRTLHYIVDSVDALTWAVKHKALNLLRRLLLRAGPAANQLCSSGYAVGAILESPQRVQLLELVLPAADWVATKPLKQITEEEDMLVMMRDKRKRDARASVRCQLLLRRSMRRDAYLMPAM